MTHFIQNLVPPMVFRQVKRLQVELKFMAWPHKQRLCAQQTLRSLKTSETAFLIATGPSLKFENLQLLAGHDCYSVSNFFLHPDLNSVNPKIHFFAPWHPPLIRENYGNG